MAWDVNTSPVVKANMQKMQGYLRAACDSLTEKHRGDHETITQGGAGIIIALLEMAAAIAAAECEFRDGGFCDEDAVLAELLEVIGPRLGAPGWGYLRAGLLARSSFPKN